MRTDYGYMKRRIEALESENSLLGQRVQDLEAQLRAENGEPIPGDIGVEWFINDDQGPTRIYRMLPPEQGNEHR